MKENRKGGGVRQPTTKYLIFFGLPYYWLNYWPLKCGEILSLITLAYRFIRKSNETLLTNAITI